MYRYMYKHVSEIIALTLFVVVLFSIVISQLGSEVNIIPEWECTKNNNNPKVVTCSNIGVSKEYSFC